MSEVKVEIAILNDAEDIARISYQVGKMHDEAVPEYFKPTDESEHLRIVKDMLKSRDNIVFKAIYEGRICGVLFLRIVEKLGQGATYSKYGVITNFGVDENYRKKGIGTALMVKVEEYVKEQGLEALDLSVFVFNSNAIKFYERLGYKALDLNMRKILK